MTEAAADKLNRRLEPLRKGAYTSSVGGRYMQGVPGIRPVARLVRRMVFWDYAAELLQAPVEALAFLSCSALDVLPGDTGLAQHVDYPHHVFPKSPHLSAQFILSLDGTDEERAPLWAHDPTNLVCMKPGELLIFGGNTLHGVHPNKSDRSRTTLLWSMGPHWIRPMLRDVWGWTGPRQSARNGAPGPDRR